MLKQLGKILFFLFLSVNIACAGSPFGSDPMDEALSAMEGGTGYTVSFNYVWLWATGYYVFRPDSSPTTTGLILYPGANIDVRSYAVLAANVAREGYTVVLVPMPLDMAIFGYNRAGKPIDQLEDIDTWAIGGHSLGGVMACNYAGNHEDKVDAVILLASYPSAIYRLDDTNIQVLSIYGTSDGLTTIDKIEVSEDHLPADAEFYEISGGNHSQFGYYSPETSGDNTAEISREEQTDQICEAITNFLSGL